MAFSKDINVHHRHRVTPSDHIHGDESISRWYGVEGEGIKMGLSHYMTYDLKLENVCELKSAACGKPGITLRVKLVMRQTGGM